MLTDDLTLSTVQCVHFVEPSEIPDFGDISRLGLSLAEMDATGVRSEDDLFSALAKALQFPEWFGRNWDALNDCLRDLEWLPGKGYLLLVHNAQEFWQSGTAIAGKFIECWLFCAEFWLEERVPFHLIFILNHKTLNMP